MQNKRKAWGHSARYRAALPGVRAVVHHTPIMRCGSVSGRLRSSTDLVLKCEHLQRTGSFKIRGAVHRLSQLPGRNAEDRRRGARQCPQHHPRPPAPDRGPGDDVSGAAGGSP